MKIIVLIKQVPDSSAVRMDETTGTIVRQAADAVVNPLDMYAVEAALILARRRNAATVAISMGPPNAERALREVLALGIGEAVLVSDKAYAGSDTWATSRILAAAIHRAAPDFTLIICGERATDGDTGQVGPGVAAALGIAPVTYVGAIGDVTATTLQADRLIEGASETVAAHLPALLTVVKAVANPRLPTLDGKLRARSVAIAKLTQTELALPAGEIGLNGSPTRVSRIFHPRLARRCRLYPATDPASIEIAVSALLNFLQSGNTLPEMTETITESPSHSSASLAAAFPVKADEPRDIWVLAEQGGGVLQPVSFELLARANELKRQNGGAVGALLLSQRLPDATLQQLITHGAGFVVAVESPSFHAFQPDAQGAAFCRLVREYKPAIVIGAATTYGRTLMPYAAMLLHTGLTADCTGLAIDPQSGLLLQTRPAIGGNIMATITCASHRPQMATVRPHSCRPLKPDQTRAGRIMRHTAGATEAQSAITVLETRRHQGVTPLQDAQKVVVVGRGIRRAEALPAVRDFANLIGAALGASREVVDRGWLPYEHQVGLSGKTITPRLYIGLGVSGAIQHLAGMQTSETIIAVNKDPQAPIFQVADIGIVGDLLAILPILTRKLRA